MVTAARMSAAQIIAAVGAVVVHPPSWYIGITEDPDRRRQEHGNPLGWYLWHADSERTARQVEKHFLALGMQGDTGGGLSPDWVYIYRR